MSRILVVEDEPAIAELISINLRHAGFEVTIAGDAEQAQVAVDGILPSLVVLDWMLPGQSGHALARAWRGQPRTRELPIIMLTARAEEADKVAGLDAGADDYLTKPFSANELLARIRAVLRRRSPEALDTAVVVGALTHRSGHASGDQPGSRGQGRRHRVPPAAFPHDPSRASAQPGATARPGLGRPRLHRGAHGRRPRQAPARVAQRVNCQHMIETVRGAGYRMTHAQAATA